MAKVLLFGRLADVAGWREQAVPGETLVAVRAALSSSNAQLAEALSGKGVQAAVDQAIVRGDAVLAPGSEVAFLPPMSGG